MLRTLSRRPSIPEVVLDPSLVLWLPLHQLDGATIASRDAYGHVATVTGAVWTPQGRSFDGVDDKIVVSPFRNQPIGNVPCTVICWMKLTDKAATYVGASFGVDSADPTAYGIYYDNTADKFHASFASSNGKAGVLSPAAGVWYHLAGVYDGTTNKLYVDGQLSESVNYNAANLQAGPVKFGAWVNDSSPLKGSLDMASIYSRASTPIEIHRLYLATRWRYQ